MTSTGLIGADCQKQPLIDGRGGERKRKELVEVERLCRGSGDIEVGEVLTVGIGDGDGGDRDLVPRIGEVGELDGYRLHLSNVFIGNPDGVVANSGTIGCGPGVVSAVVESRDVVYPEGVTECLQSCSRVTVSVPEQTLQAIPNRRNSTPSILRRG